MRNIRTTALTIILLISVTVRAQNVMTLDEAITIALENNYSLKIARNDQSMAENNVTPTPFLPTVTATGRQSYTTIMEETTSAPEPAKDVTNAMSAGVSLNWKLFDGLGMFTSYSRSKHLLEMSSRRVRIEVENLVMRICSEYYNIIVQQNRLESSLTSLSLSKLRYKNAEEKYLLGVISGLDLQQAKIDLNADSSHVLSQYEVVNSAYIRMANLLSAGHDVNFNVRDTIMLAPQMNADSLRSLTLEFNNQLILARQGEKLSEYDLKAVRALRYPTINFNAGYNLTNNNYPLPDTYYRSDGPTVGLNMTWNLFTGLETRRKIENARLEAENTRLSYLDIENEILGELDLLHNTYRNNITVSLFETENAEVARTSLEIAMERYRLGSLSGLEFREYQNKYLDAVNRKLTALYQAKVSEIGLRLLCGELTE